MGNAHRAWCGAYVACDDDGASAQMSNAVVAAERWLFSTLAASAALAALVGNRIFGDLVPPNTVFPLVFYTLPGARDNLMTLNANFIWSELPYTVRYVDKVESYVTLEAGATAIENALSRASGSNVSGVICASIYRAPFKMTEIDKDGSTLCHLGGFYDLYVQ